MATTIVGTATDWTITSPAGEICGAGKNEANAYLTANNTVVIQSNNGVLWTGPITLLTGLVGATPADLFNDLLNNYLTGLPAAGFLGSQQYTLQNAPYVHATGAPDATIPLDALFLSQGATCSELSATPGVIEIKVAGTYLIILQGVVAKTAGLDTNLLMAITRLTGSFTFPIRGRARFSGPGTINQYQSATALVDFAVGDTFSVVIGAYTAVGTSYNVVNTAAGLLNTFVSVVCLNPVAGGSSGTTSLGAIINRPAPGETLVTTTSNPYQVRRLIAGTGITITATAPALTLSTTAPGFSVSYGTPTNFTAAFVSVPFNDYFRNSGTFTWLGPTTSSVAGGSTMLFNVGVTISVASTGTITFQISDAGQVYLSRSVAPGYTGPLTFSGIASKVGGAGTLVLQAKSTVADGQYDFSYGAVGSRNNWFDGTLLS